MRVPVGAMCVLATLLCAATVCSQIPGVFELCQNDPNPFCAGPHGEWTSIRYDVPEPAFIRVVVGDPTGLIVVRTLVYGQTSPGYYEFLWDGLDDWDDYLPTETYPYSLQLRDPGTGRWSEIRGLWLTIDCTTNVRPETWGRIKALYRLSEGPTAN